MSHWWSSCLHVVQKNCDLLQVHVNLSLSYAKHDADDVIQKCADLVEERFVGIAGPLKGAKNLEKIKPPDMTMITVGEVNTVLNRYTCPNGELRQDSVCGRCHSSGLIM